MTRTSRLIALHRAAQAKPDAIRDRLAARGLVLRTFDLTPTMHTRLQDAAAVTGRPVDDLVDEAIREWTAEAEGDVPACAQ
ncbi:MULTISPECIES: hypothetical protein [unclassified Streptomyces]|uniref:hypothetical protein n=1 Tax=unclassified Streptomyces TaxID=2593676 RepID=UPI000F6C3009|nr:MULTISPECIES: hypothetical protein [unclassified Streptomyces]AZM64973.1 hypothetical protein DLM49_36345 [Streptomyces sp. WAC 01438]RSM86218.1 hypothetical protein DMA10_36600 [Streptomyces sp. WAC 01420]